jgi:hypothetical protein
LLLGLLLHLAYLEIGFSITYCLIDVRKICSILEIHVVEVVIVLDFAHVLDIAQAEG